MLHNEESRALVVQALTEQENQVTAFVALLLKEEEKQSADGKPNIVITDVACKN